MQNLTNLNILTLAVNSSTTLSHVEKVGILSLISKIRANMVALSKELKSTDAADDQLAELKHSLEQAKEELALARTDARAQKASVTRLTKKLNRLVPKSPPPSSTTKGASPSAESESE